MVNYNFYILNLKYDLRIYFIFIKKKRRKTHELGKNSDSAPGISEKIEFFHQNSELTFFRVRAILQYSYVHLRGGEARVGP